MRFEFLRCNPTVVNSRAYIKDFAEYFLPLRLENFVVLHPKFFKNIMRNLLVLVPTAREDSR